MDRIDLINSIIDAAIHGYFNDNIDDVEILSYTTEDGKTYEDRFDYINPTTIPCTIHFIGGTGHPDFSIPLSSLTDQSLNDLCNCITK